MLLIIPILIISILQKTLFSQLYQYDVYYRNTDGYWVWIEMHRKENNIRTISAVMSNNKESLIDLIELGRKYKRKGETDMQGLSFLHHYKKIQSDYVYIPKIQLRYYNSVMASSTSKNSTRITMRTFDDMNSFTLKLENEDNTHYFYRTILL